MSNIINIAPERVLITDTFDTQKSYLYVDQETREQENTRLFTRTLRAENLQVFLEQDTNVKSKKSISEAYYYDDGGYQGPYREDYGPALPTNGPFLSYYSVTGSIDLKLFANLLLIDKPPISTGFYQFFIKGTSFHGLIRQLTPYDHYNWEVTNKFGRGRYGYVKQNRPIGFAIEIANNQLYNSEYVDGGEGGTHSFYNITPKPLKAILESLTGEEEIVSGPPTFNPSTYNLPVRGLDKITSYSNDENQTNIYDFTRGYDLFSLSDADALYYIASYPDLINAFGTDVNQGKNHYIRFGIQEGRQISFDPIAYINKYADIKQLSGTDTVGATIHYIVFGYREGRTIASSSSNLTSRGGLYDERYSAIGIVDDVIIWPNGRTMAGKGKTLTYRFVNTSYYLNGLIDFPDSSIFLRKQ
jgi:hypothetical protein